MDPEKEICDPLPPSCSQTPGRGRSWTLRSTSGPSGTGSGRPSRAQVGGGGGLVGKWPAAKVSGTGSGGPSQAQVGCGGVLEGRDRDPDLLPCIALAPLRCTKRHLPVWPACLARLVGLPKQRRASCHGTHPKCMAHLAPSLTPPAQARRPAPAGASPQCHPGWTSRAWTPGWLQSSRPSSCGEGGSAAAAAVAACRRAFSVTPPRVWASEGVLWTGLSVSRH